MTTPTTLPPGPALDQKVCELLGIEPASITFWAVSERGRLQIFADSREEALTLLDDGEELKERFKYPPVSTDRGTMWLVTDALEAKGLWWRVGPHREGGYIAIIGDPEGAMEAVNWVEETAPAALCRACLRALGKEDGG